MAKPTLNPDIEPSGLIEITQDFMFYYLKAKGTKEDKKWYINLCESKQEKSTNPITNETVLKLNTKAVRKEFALKFFPHLVKQKKKGQSYMDLVKTLLDD